MAFDLVATLRLQDKLTAPMEKVKKAVNDTSEKTKSLTDRLGGMKTALGTIGVTVGLTALSKQIVSIGASFDEQMAKVQAVSGANEEQFGRLAATARQLGKDTKFSMTEAGEGMEYLALAGWETDAIIAAMPGMLDLAAAGALDLGRAADITSDTMQSFGMKSSEATHAADVFAYAQANANTNVEQMGEAMKFVAPVANAFSWSLEETAAAQMALADSGLKGSIAGQAFASSLTRLSKPTDQMGKLWKSTNTEFFTAEGQLKKMPDLVAELEKATKGMTEEQRASYLSTTFGMEAYKHWAILLERGSDSLRTMTTELENSDGAAKKMAATMIDQLKGDWQIFISGVQEAAYSIYELFQPALRTLVKGLTKAVAIVPAISKGIKAIAAPFKRAGNAIRKTGDYLRLFFALVTSDADGIKKMMEKLGFDEEQLGSFRKIATLTKAAIGVLKELAKPFEPILNSLNQMKTGVEAFFLILSGDKVKAGDIMNKVGITPEQAKTVRKAARLVSEAFEWISDTTTKVVEGVKNLFEKLVELKDGAISKVTEKLSEFKDVLEENEEKIRKIATVLAVVFGPALAKVAFQAGITAAVIVGKLVFSMIMMGIRAGITAAIMVGKFVWSLVRVAAQTIITAAVITGKMIIALVRFAASGYIAIARVTALTVAFVAQRVAMVAGAAVMGALTAAQWLWNAAMAANPIGAVIALVAGLIAVGVLLVKNWDKVKSAWGKTMDFILSAAEKSINFVIDIFNKLIKTINKIPGVDVPLVAKVDITEAEEAAKKSGGKKKKGKSNYHGIESVPYDGYQATLHRGERVQTAQEVRAEKRNGGKLGAASVMITGNTFHVRKDADIDAVANALFVKLRTAAEGGA